METLIIEQRKIIVFKKLKKAYKEYLEESKENISLSEFFINVLNYSKEDFKDFIIAKHSYTEKRKHKLPSSIEPKIAKNKGIRNHPDYDKYFGIICEYRKYLIENKKRINLKDFISEKYNISIEEALEEAKKIHLILYSKNGKI